MNNIIVFSLIVSLAIIFSVAEIAINWSLVVALIFSILIAIILSEIIGVFKK